jgi:hypothetical protein
VCNKKCLCFFLWEQKKKKGNLRVLDVDGKLVLNSILD